MEPWGVAETRRLRNLRLHPQRRPRHSVLANLPRRDEARPSRLRRHHAAQPAQSRDLSSRAAGTCPRRGGESRRRGSPRSHRAQGQARQSAHGHDRIRWPRGRTDAAAGGRRGRRTRCCASGAPSRPGANPTATTSPGCCSRKCRRRPTPASVPITRCSDRSAIFFRRAAAGCAPTMSIRPTRIFACRAKLRPGDSLRRRCAAVFRPSTMRRARAARIAQGVAQMPDQGFCGPDQPFDAADRQRLFGD